MKKTLLMLFIALVTVNVMAQSYLVQVKPDGSKLWGYANEKGELIVPAKYKKCFPFSEGYAVVLNGKEYGFIKHDGGELETSVKGFRLAKSSLFGLQGFSDGLVQISKDGKWGYLDTDGQTAIDLKYDFTTKFSGGFALVKRGAEFFVLNKRGEEIAITVANVAKIKEFSEGFAPITFTDKTVGFIGTDGKLAIDNKFRAVGYFKNGLAWAKNESNLLGYIGTDGNWVVEAKFAAGKNFDKKSELARIKFEDKWAYTNRSGTLLFIKNTEVWGDFSDGLAKGKITGKFGFYDNTGNWIIAPKFEGVRNFKNGFAAAKLKGKWGVINTNGDWVIQPVFIAIKDLELIK